MFAQATRPQLVGFVFENKGAGGGDLVDKIVVVQSKADRLPPDRRMRFEIVDHLEAIGRTRQCRERRPFVRYLDRLSDDQGREGGVLVDDARFPNRIDKRRAASIPGGQFTD